MLDARTKQIWSGLVDYANAPDLQSNPEASNSLAQILFECMPWMARTAFDDDVPAMIALRTNREVLFGQVNGKRVWLFMWKSEEQLANQFRQQAIEYQLQVRQLLTWLSDRELKAQERNFLYEHTMHIEFQRGDPAYAPEEEQFRYFTPEGDLKDDFPFRTMAYKDIADPICDFIQRQHELERDVPIQICKRPGCGNPVVRFKKKEYCRTALCDKERQKRDTDVKQKKNRDRVFIHRLTQFSRPMRRKKAQQKVRHLSEIEAYWRDSDHANETLASKASELLALAGNTSETGPRSGPADGLGKNLRKD